MISDTTRLVIDLFIRIVFYSGFVAGPIMILILLMYQYEKYKKWKDKEIKEAERIIVKKNEQIVETSVAINQLEGKKAELVLAVDSLEARLKEMKIESGDVTSTEDETANKTISDKLTIKELHALARERKVKGFSRMKKEELLKILGQ